jgi:hypothetical protein
MIILFASELYPFYFVISLMEVNKRATVSLSRGAGVYKE